MQISTLLKQLFNTNFNENSFKEAIEELFDKFSQNITTKLENLLKKNNVEVSLPRIDDETKKEIEDLLAEKIVPLLIDSLSVVLDGVVDKVVEKVKDKFTEEKLTVTKKK